MNRYIRLLRVKHYLKNVLVMIPAFFAGTIFADRNQFSIIILGFLGFSLASSITYIINDIKDVEKDRVHPIKRKRPIASGEISLDHAKKCLLIIACLIIIMMIYIEKLTHSKTYILLLLYIFLNILYSFGLKNIPIVDIIILASGFLLRVVYGGIIAGVPVSQWLYLTVISLSFYMGLGKRRNELTNVSPDDTRGVLKYYNYNFLDKNMYMYLTLSLIFYSLWTVDPITISRMGNSWLSWTIPIVMIICMKYSLIIEGNSLGDPIDVLTSDKTLIGLTGFYSCVMLFLYCRVYF